MAAAITAATALIASERTEAGRSGEPRLLRPRTARIAHRCTLPIWPLPILPADPPHGGEGGIRTHGTVSRSGAFKAPALVHYATSPSAVPRARDCGEHPDPSRPRPHAMARCGA